jgi:hypothetical protein
LTALIKNAGSLQGGVDRLTQCDFKHISRSLNADGVEDKPLGNELVFGRSAGRPARPDQTEMALTEREFRDEISQVPWTEIKEEFEAGRFGLNVVWRKRKASIPGHKERGLSLMKDGQLCLSGKACNRQTYSGISDRMSQNSRHDVSELKVKAYLVKQLRHCMIRLTQRMRRKIFKAGFLQFDCFVVRGNEDNSSVQFRKEKKQE